MPQAFILRSIPSQRGIATLIAIVALLIMTIAVLALVRSSDTSSLIAGNLAFRRDLTNQAQIAVSQASAAFTTGLLNSETARQASVPAANYSATMLTAATNNPSQGIPADLMVSDATFDANTANYAVPVIQDNGVFIRYVIDRLCTSTGPATALTCVQGQQSSDKGGTAGIQKAGGSFIPVYRITVRVTGPHNTQAFLQSTLVD